MEAVYRRYQRFGFRLFLSGFKSIDVFELNGGRYDARRRLADAETADIQRGYGANHQIDDSYGGQDNGEIDEMGRRDCSKPRTQPRIDGFLVFDPLPRFFSEACVFAFIYLDGRYSGDPVSGSCLLFSRPL